MAKRKYLKVAVGAEEYALLCRAADHRGLTLSAFVRRQLDERHKPLTLEAQLSRIELQLKRATEKTNAPNPDRMLLEVLLLMREFAAERSAQVLVRVRQKLEAASGEGRV